MSLRKELFGYALALTTSVSHSASIVPDNVLWYKGFIRMSARPFTDSTNGRDEDHTWSSGIGGAEIDGVAHSPQEWLEALQRQAPVGVPSIEDHFVNVKCMYRVFCCPSSWLCDVGDEKT